MATAEATTVAPTVAPTSIICVACLGAALLAADGRARLVDGVNAVTDAAAAAMVTSFITVAMMMSGVRERHLCGGCSFAEFNQPALLGPKRIFQKK